MTYVCVYKLVMLLLQKPLQFMYYGAETVQVQGAKSSLGLAMSSAGAELPLFS